MAITPEIQAQLYKETDARFAAQTGVTHKLDPKSKLDQKLIPVWVDIYNHVKHDYDGGVIVWTYNHPAVADALSQAQAMGVAAAQHFDAAQSAPTPETHAQASSDMHGAVAAASNAAKQAAAVQNTLTPPSPNTAAFLTGAAENILHALHGVGEVLGLSGGHDSIAAVQATQAPAHAAAVSPSPASALAPVLDALTSDAHTIQHVPHAKIDTKKALIGIGVASAFYGLIVLLNSSVSRRHRRRSRPRYARRRR